MDNKLKTMVESARGPREILSEIAPVMVGAAGAAAKKLAMDNAKKKVASSVKKAVVNKVISKASGESDTTDKPEKKEWLDSSEKNKSTDAEKPKDSDTPKDSSKAAADKAKADAEARANKSKEKQAQRKAKLKDGVNKAKTNTKSAAKDAFNVAFDKVLKGE